MTPGEIVSRLGELSSGVRWWFVMERRGEHGEESYHCDVSTLTNQLVSSDEENEILRLLEMEFGTEEIAGDGRSRNSADGTSYEPGHREVFDVQNESTSHLEVLVPPDPHNWSSGHIRCWLEWAQKTLPSAHQLQLNSFQSPATGQQLCSYNVEQLAEMCGSLVAAQSLYEHLCHLQRRVGGAKRIMGGAEWRVGVSEQEEGGAKLEMGGAESLSNQQLWQSSSKSGITQEEAKCRCVQISMEAGRGSHRQLWQFLLQMLEAPELHSHELVWEGPSGEFRLVDPAAVATVWGMRKSKSTMNYDKFSRALRYYYDKNILAKVPGKKFAYKFDFIALLRSADHQLRE